LFAYCDDSFFKWCIFQTTILSQSPPFGRTCGGPKKTCPQRRKLSKFAKRLQRLEEAHARQNPQEEDEWRLHTFAKQHHQHQPQQQHSFNFVKLPSFSGSNDPSLYLA